MKSFLRQHPRRAAAIALGTAGVLAMAGCASGGDGDSGGGDGEVDTTLLVGSILPETGNLSYLGPPEFAGVDLAVADLEEAGYEFDIETNHQDSGDTSTDVATTSAQTLIDAGADVVIGAASSGVSQTFMDQLFEAGVVQISPANTAPDFSEYDDDGFYWRTAPSDVIQGNVLGNLMVNNGAANVAFIYVNDPYGEGLADYTGQTVEDAGGTVVASVPYNIGDTSFDAQISEVLDAEPDAIGLLAFDETSVIVPQLVGTQDYPAENVYFVDGNLSNTYDWEDGLIEGAYGTQPGNPGDADFRDRLLEVNPDLVDFNYGPESYDAVILAALAAAQGGSADAVTIRDNLQSVSEGGTECTAVADCLELIADGEDIDYNGASGPIEFNENGDPTQAFIGVYQYGADNQYEIVSTEEGTME